MPLVPAFMRVVGHPNRWAPKPLALLHDRIGLNEMARHTATNLSPP
jgi:RND superfamily putative drug exporter